MGLGTLVLLANATLLWLLLPVLPLLPAHLRRPSQALLAAPGALPARGRFVSRLNTRHALFAWVSLFGVALTDFYVRCVATGAIHDIRGSSELATCRHA